MVHAPQCPATLAGQRSGGTLYTPQASFPDQPPRDGLDAEHLQIGHAAGAVARTIAAISVEVSAAAAEDGTHWLHGPAGSPKVARSTAPKQVSKAVPALDRLRKKVLESCSCFRRVSDAVEEFHGQTERGVRQELYAHFNLIAMTRLLSNRGDGLLEDLCKEDEKRQTTNFRNALAMMAANLEELVLARAAALARIVAWMEERILAVRSRLRPGRSYPRQSMQPRDKWSERARAAA